MAAGSYERCRLALLSTCEEKWGCDCCLRAMQAGRSTGFCIHFRFHTLTRLYHDNVSLTTRFHETNDWYDEWSWSLMIQINVTSVYVNWGRLILLYSSAMAAISRTPPNTRQQPSYLHGIGADYFPLKPPSDLDRQFGLAGTGSSQNHHQRRNHGTA